VLLAVDIGNTNTVLALFDHGGLLATWRIGTDRRATADELALKVRGLLGSDVAAISGVAACSTVPSLRRELHDMLGRYHADVPCLVVDPGRDAGWRLAVDDAFEVGADRVVNALAAHTRFGGPAVVVDFGTCTNFDVVGADGEFLGGVLAPGIGIAGDALAAQAAQLRAVEPVRSPRAIGKNTVEALQAGMVYGAAGQVDGVVERIMAALERPVTAVVATGGLAPLVVGECRTVTHHEPHLTLLGLLAAHDRRFAPVSLLERAS